MKSLLFLLTFLPSYTFQQCVNAQCVYKDQTQQSTCLQSMSGSATSGGNVVFVGDLCDSTNRYYCDPSVDSSNMYTGKCVQNTLFFEYYPTYIQFPGELCDPNRAFYECGFGYKKCMAKRCYGYLAGENCISSADCNPHLYCDQSNQTCSYAVQLSGSCTSNDQCDMGMRCVFDSNIALTGICQNYFSLPSNTPVYASQASDLFVCADGFGFLDAPNNGTYDVRNFQQGLYRCGKELLSTSAGQTCTSYLDCPTNIAGVYAYCGCTYSGQSQQCDVLYSNHEYQDYVQAAVSFQAATSSCHNARVLESGPCDQLDLFRNMMCKKMQAFYYLPNFGASQCMNLYSNQYLFSEIDETQLWCSPNRYGTLLGLQWGRVSNAVSLALIAVATLTQIFM